MPYKEGCLLAGKQPVEAVNRESLKAEGTGDDKKVEQVAGIVGYIVVGIDHLKAADKDKH